MGKTDRGEGRRRGLKGSRHQALGFMSLPVLVCLVAWIQPIVPCLLGLQVWLPLAGSLEAVISTSANVRPVSGSVHLRLALCSPGCGFHLSALLVKWFAAARELQTESCPLSFHLLEIQDEILVGRVGWDPCRCRAQQQNFA